MENTRIEVALFDVMIKLADYLSDDGIQNMIACLEDLERCRKAKTDEAMEATQAPKEIACARQCPSCHVWAVIRDTRAGCWWCSNPECSYVQEDD